MKSMGCASAAATWEAAGRGGSDDKLTSGMEWTGKPETGTFMTVGGIRASEHQQPHFPNLECA